MERMKSAFMTPVVSVSNLMAQSLALGVEVQALVLARLRGLAGAPPVSAPENPFSAYARGAQANEMLRAAWRHVWAGRPDRAMLEIIQIWRKEIRAQARVLEEAGTAEALAGPEVPRLMRPR
ncbi:hypothetical protein [Acidocella sp.]|uniref:hypothetical protein n=1 Tax=Acidocella sp. TaxID=50710 RepID=UPI002626C7AC|nr:hypothetical protein [Acidocella sp.]